MKIFRNALLLGSLALLASCNTTEPDKTSDGTTNKPDTTAKITPAPTTPDTTKTNPADVTGQAATNILGTKEIASDSVRSAMDNVPTEVGGRLAPAARKNLLDANQTYRSLLAANPNDPVAGFGIAVTSLSLNADDLSDSLKRLFDRVDIGVSGDAGSLFKLSPTALVKSESFASRSFADPKKAPKISELQDLLETKLVPSVDSAIGFLTKCWNTPNFKYKFAIHIHGNTDSVAIGRADVGFALAGLRTAKVYFTWILAQNVDIDFNGSYSWIDTLSHIDVEVGPTTTAQNSAFGNLQTLLAPGSAFLTVRAGKQTGVNAIPAELVDIASLAKEAGDYSVSHQLKITDGLVRLSASDNAEFAEVMDSVKVYLNGFHTYVRSPYTSWEYVDSTCSGKSSYYNYTTKSTRDTTYSYMCGTSHPVQKPGFSITLNVSKLITQADHKVFLPKFSWNAAADWAAKGAFNLVKGTTHTPINSFEDLNINGPKDMDPYMEWTDPSFGGAFTFTSSTAVLNQLDVMNDNSSQTTVSGTGTESKLYPTPAF